MSKFVQKIFFFIAFMSEIPLFAVRVPAWFEHKELSYPSEFYISAIGEGATENEAKNNALSQISLFFHTNAEVCNELIKTYNETETKNSYSSKETTSIVEKAKIRSQAEFFGVQFTGSFAVKQRIYVLAFIERESVFKVYEQEIKQNALVLTHMLEYAENPKNYVTGLNCAKSAVTISALTAELVKNARIVKSVSENYFSSVENLINRSYTALKTCQENLTFTISVQNDWKDTIYTTLSKLMEERGYAVSSGGDKSTSTLSVTVTADENQTGAGVFLYAKISVTALATDGKPYFSYARTFDKKGARKQADAYRLTYKMIADELKKSFIYEFDEHTQPEFK